MANEPRRRMAREDRRASLLDAATRVVAAKPRERLSFEAIATEAGVSPTLPYKYFDSPEDVALELYTRAVADVDERTDAVLADRSVTFDDKVRTTVALWCALVERDHFLVVRLAEGANAAALERAVRRRREQAVRVWADQIRFEFGLDEATARVVAASVTAGAGAAVQRVFTDRIDREHVANLLARLVRAQCEQAATAGLGVS